MGLTPPLPPPPQQTATSFSFYFSQSSADNVFELSVNERQTMERKDPASLSFIDLNIYIHMMGCGVRMWWQPPRPYANGDVGSKKGQFTMDG
jgi:hypothetical protein